MPQTTTKPRRMARERDVAPAAVKPAKQPSKLDQVEALLLAPTGATIADIMTATGWQQHSVRAALTRLRKQGHHLIKEPGPTGGSVYQITHNQPAKA